VTSQQRPFEGLTVLDLTRVLSGPFCTMLLADHGARVIKVERPGTGDDSRSFGPFFPEDKSKSVYFHFVNRGKESIALNLKDDADRAVLDAMLEKADIVVENFRPGTMAKLGYAPEDLRKRYPKLIVCSISGFGQSGPLSKLPAYDTVIQAMSGLMSVTGFPDGPPTRVGTSIADLGAGLFAFASISAALAARERTGQGTTVDIAMLDGIFSLLEHGLMDTLAEHKEARRIGNRHPSICPFDTFACRDRELVICCGNDHLFAEMCDEMGCPELSQDDRFVSNEKRIENIDALKEAMESALANDDAAKWLDRLQARGVPCGLINTVMESRELPQVIARNLVVDSGGHQVPGNPIKYGSWDDSINPKSAPVLDAEGQQLRAEFTPPA